jgi:hypothetical protein
MSGLGCLLASTGGEVGLPWETLDPATKEYLLVLGALAAVSLLVFGWALFVRRRRHHHGHHHAHHHSHQESQPSEPSAVPSPSAPAAAGRNGDSGRRRRSRSIFARLFPRRHRRRRQRQRERAMNPTLADTGGMPPARSEQPPADFP